MPVGRARAARPRRLPPTLPYDGTRLGAADAEANLTGRQFNDANLQSSGGTATNFSGATLIGTNFSGADCTGANFSGATLGGETSAVMSMTMLRDASFTDAQLSGVNFSGAYLYDAASVSGATMPGVDFSNAYLAGLDLSYVRNGNLAGAVFDGACCVNCIFKGTSIERDKITGRGGSFVSACLQGADFTDASLAGANLDNAGCAPRCPTSGTCTFPATLTIAGTQIPVPIIVNDAGTLLPASVTDSTSVCPDDSKGPCRAAQLYPAGAPTSWPVSAHSPHDSA